MRMRSPPRSPSSSPLLAGIALLLLAGTAVAQPALDEARFVERVLSTSLEARVAGLEAALGRAEAVGAGSWPNPELEWERQKTTSGTRAGESQDVLMASIPLVLSGRLGLEAEAADRNARAAEARYEWARAGLRYEAARGFSAVLAARERRSILEQSLAELRHLAEVIATRERAGEAAGYDRLRIELEAATVQDALRGAVLDEHQAEAQALRLLGPGVTVLPPLEGSLAAERPLPDGAALLAELGERRGDLRALALEGSSAEAARRGAGRGWIPEPSVRAGAQFLDVGLPGAGVGYVVGVGLPLPLFDRRQGEAARAEARRGLAEARRAALLHEARSRLAVVLEAVSSRRERQTRHRTEVLGRAQELRQIAATAYRGGGAEPLVLVDAERAVREARLAAVELAVSLVEAETDLLLVAGAYDGAMPRSATR
ncbi:cobalt-zinc-cadmium efflux system outer membrane protein [Archangium gephyra]|uniref:Cobalt-zinc-cadmium efflux system outer membrane protein n=1 Tax=Archangium gephyra TaxID=48 RepID=A0AAC8QDA1_9BACT|nr:TolC family protein [Archangium gephyra]AKJ05384.1 Heavy metal RND efflux outer membrane protein, CzcC family [Archangium gephyra]REG36069.1 cobalt-zinc-cadmium efflux system outer membrane protein [Archangium gephyra]